MQDYGVKIQLQLNFHTNTFVIMSFASNFSFYQRMKVFEKSCEIKGVQLPKDFDPNVIVRRERFALSANDCHEQGKRQ